MLVRAILILFVLSLAVSSEAAISRPVACNTATANTVAAPTHAIGDFLIVAAWRATDATDIVPPGDFTVMFNSGAGSTRLLDAGYLIADTTSESVGTWTAAETVIACVFRGLDPADPIGTQGSTNNASSTSMDYPAITFEVTNGSSWLLTMGGARTIATADLGEAPGAQTQIGLDDDGGGNGGLGVHSSEGGLSSWALTSVTIASASWRTIVFELRAAATVTSSARRNFLLGF